MGGRDYFIHGKSISVMWGCGNGADCLAFSVEVSKCVTVTPRQYQFTVFRVLQCEHNMLWCWQNMPLAQNFAILENTISKPAPQGIVQLPGASPEMREEKNWLFHRLMTHRRKSGKWSYIKLLFDNNYLKKK